jgi:hypothetical protein
MPHHHRCAHWSGHSDCLVNERTLLRSTDMLTRLCKFPLSVCSCRNIAVGRHTLIGTTTKSWIRAHGKVFGPPFRRIVHNAEHHRRAHGHHLLIAAQAKDAGSAMRTSAAPMNDRIASPTTPAEAAVERASHGEPRKAIAATADGDAREVDLPCDRTWAVRTLIGRSPTQGRPRLWSQSCRRGDVEAFARIFGIGSSKTAPSRSSRDGEMAISAVPEACNRCNDPRCAVRYLVSGYLVAHPAQGEVPALFFRCL